MQVVLEGYRTSPRQPEDDTVKFLGYCPQENSLWPSLTGKDHVELYAAVKGMSKQEAALSTSRYRRKLCGGKTGGTCHFLIKYGKEIINKIF